MKVLTVIGARPQFVKAAPVSKALRASGITEYLVHTGQHYDYGMSQIFFNELQISPPDVNLAIGSGSHGRQTGQMLMQIEEILIAQKPDFVLVFGDTNSTLAGALAAVKLNIPVAHVEAGLRSFNRSMPEEHNRVLTDHCSTLLFCPTLNAIELLAREGVIQGVHLVGDTMFDAVLQFRELAKQRSTILSLIGIEPKQYYLATVHRPYNTDVPANLVEILTAFAELDRPVIFPIHPRTRQKVSELALDIGMQEGSRLRMIDPVGYLDMLVLQENASAILTDSGGLQKEAYFLGVPCVTLRPETEWIETVDAGWNTLVDVKAAQIISVVAKVMIPDHRPNLYGEGDASLRIAELIQSSGHSS